MRKRTFSIPDDIDLAIRRIAIDDNKRFSDVVGAALKMYVNMRSSSKKEVKTK